jgi:hypothetical protein
VTVSRVLALGMLMSIIPGTAALADPIGQISAVDAYLNLGSGPYAGAGFIASGNPEAWYDSPQVARLFGGVPTAQQQQGFDQTVLQRVQQTFQLSGISVSLTENAGVSALHTLSLVSNASSSAFPGAIGTTDLGASGLSFIDPQAQAAQSVDQLEWIVAHNISHELMLAFGVGENYDKTGNYIDARNANFSMLINPNATFSTGAAAAIKAQLPSSSFEQVFQPDAQGIAPLPAPLPAPEPSTIAVWGILTAVAIVASRTRRRVPLA